MKNNGIQIVFFFLFQYQFYGTPLKAVALKTEQSRAFSDQPAEFS
jgi:hypothetical protein